jgi:hypothetical protein
MRSWSPSVKSASANITALVLNHKLRPIYYEVVIQVNGFRVRYLDDVSVAKPVAEKVPSELGSIPGPYP